MGKIFANHVSDQGLTSDIRKALLQLNRKSINSDINKNETHLTLKWAETLRTHFSKEDIRKAPGHGKRCSASLLIREAQIQTMARRRLTPVGAATIRKTDNNECWRGRGETGASCAVTGSVKRLSRCGNSVEFPQKIKIELPRDPAIPPLGKVSRKMKTGYRKDICIPIFTGGLFIIAKI